VLAAAAVQITEFVGLPECALTLAQAVTYMSCCPKSNASCAALAEARDDVRNQRTLPVPKALRDTHYQGAKSLGNDGYKYPHDSPEGYVVQDYLGVAKQYYHPTDRGREATFRQYLEKLVLLRTDSAVSSGGSATPGQGLAEPKS